jgi:hypothetical protein
MPPCNPLLSSWPIIERLEVPSSSFVEVAAWREFQ